MHIPCENNHIDKIGILNIGLVQVEKSWSSVCPSHRFKLCEASRMCFDWDHE